MMKIIKMLWASLCLYLLMSIAQLISEKMNVGPIVGVLTVACWVFMNGLMEEADDAAWNDEVLPQSYRWKFVVWLGLVAVTIFSWL